MAQMKVPTTDSSVKTISYDNLLGVDYQSDVTEVNRRRSPEMVNMISDLGGNPVKRFGYRSLGSRYEGFATINGDEWAVKIVTSSSLRYVWAVRIEISSSGVITETADTTKLCNKALAVNDTVNSVFGFQNSLYVLCSKYWIIYNTVTGSKKVIGTDESVGWQRNATDSNYIELIKPDDAFIPTAYTLLRPDGASTVSVTEGTTTTGATRGINILTPYRRAEYFVTTDTADTAKFVLPNCKYISPDVKVEVLDKNTFEWIETNNFTLSSNTDLVCQTPDHMGNAHTNVKEAYITFSSQPYRAVAEPHNLSRSGENCVILVDKNGSWISDGNGVISSGDTIGISVASSEGSYITGIYINEVPYKSGAGTTRIDGFNFKVNGDVNITVKTSTTEPEIVEGTIPNMDIDVVKYLMFNDGVTTYANMTRVPANQPNVRITYAPFNMEVFSVITNVTPNVNSYYGFMREDRCELMNTKVTSFFDSRLFVANGVHTYYSRASEPFNIDDNFYFDIDNDVMQYAKTSSYLAVIGKDTGHNTIYLASGSFDSTLQMTVYSVKASNSGVGAVSTKCFGTINDEPVFLANSGLYGIQTNYLSEKYAINRSGKINRRLCAESNLSNAVGINHNSYFYIAINGKMYVLDSRHRDTSKNGDSSYECYYFEDMPNITNMFVVNNRMFFEDSSYIYTWNDAVEPKYRYIDKGTDAVKAKWCSVADGDNYPHYYKVLNKKGTMVTMPYYEQTSCEITLIRDGADEFYLGRFDGTNIKLSDIAEDAMTRKKVKKYKRLQFVIENNDAEPFGITSIVKTTTLNNYAKR